MLPLATIGYEGASQGAVIAKLAAAGVTLVLDVRAIAVSRRPGFSKTILAASLAEAGIDYRHLRALGTPKAGRLAARAGRTDEMRAIYQAHLEEPDALGELALATDLANHRPCALLCYEAEASRCHRSIVAARICERIGCDVSDL
jgi:uncharacterized protein (DUF488 family)